MKRSYFHWTEIAEMFLALVAQDFEGVVQNARRVFSHFGDTTVLEKLMHGAAEKERDASHKRQSLASMVRDAIVKKTLSQEFKYAPKVTVDMVADDAAAKSSLPKTIFQARTTKSHTGHHRFCG